MTATVTYKSFAITKAYVAAYSTSVAASWTEFPLAADGTLTQSIAEAEVRDGEGVLDHTWFHTQTATVTLRGKETSLRVLEIVTGNATSSVSGGEQLYFGTNDELTPPLVRLKMVAKAIDQDDTEGYFVVIAFKARGRFPSLGLAETTPGEVSIDFTLQQSAYDDRANSIPAAFGRMVAVPTTYTSA